MMPALMRLPSTHKIRRLHHDVSDDLRSLEFLSAWMVLELVVRMLSCLLTYDFIWRACLTAPETVISLIPQFWANFAIDFDGFDSIDLSSSVKKRGVYFRLLQGLRSFLWKSLFFFKLTTTSKTFGTHCDSNNLPNTFAGAELIWQLHCYGLIRY